jgi:hypothetical protein
MKKSQPLQYPASEYQDNYRTDPSIVPERGVLSYGRQVRSADSQPSRIMDQSEVNKSRCIINKC